MQKTIISAVILLVILSVTGCTTERYAAYMRERPAATTLAMMNKPDAGSSSQNRDSYYPSSYSLLFGNTDPPSIVKNQDAGSLSQDRDKYYYYPRSYRLFFAN
jgi:hypothetical protein